MKWARTIGTAAALIACAAPAHADPISAFVAGIIGSVAPAVGTAAFGFYAAGASFASSFIGAALIRVATAIGFSALAKALSPKPRATGIQLTATAGGVVPESFLVGRYATAGHVPSPAMSHGSDGKTPNAYLTVVVELGGVAGMQLDGLILDSDVVEITGTIHPDYGNELGGKYAGYAWVKFYDGTQTAADPMLVAKYGADPDRPWTEDMIGTGICYAILTYRYNRNLFSSIPKARFELLGLPLYDPRADTTAGGSGAQRWDDPSTWATTNNPAVMIYNILRGIEIPGTGTSWGGSAAASDLPFDNWVAAMNVCDESIDLSGGGTEPRYRAGLEVTLDQQPADVIEELLKACAGDISEIGGTWKIRAGGPGLPVMFITDADVIISEAQDFAPFPTLTETHNGISASYPEPASLWESRDAPPRYNAAWEEADQGRRLVADLQLPSVPYGNQVQRLMQAWIEDARRFRQHGLTLPPDAAILEPLDTIGWTSDANGYSSKVFDIAGIGDDQVTLLQRLTMREVNPDDYDWTTANELPSTPKPAGVVTVPTPVAPGITISDEVRIRAQQPIGVLIVDVGWSASVLDTAEVQYRNTGSSQWIAMGLSDAGRFEAVGVDRGQYDIRARATTIRSSSEWVYVNGWEASLAGLPPSDVTGLAISVVGATAHLTWSAPSEEAVSYYQVRWSPLTTGASYANATTIVPRVARPATGVTVAARPGTYFVRVIDKLGNESLAPASVTTSISVDDNRNLVEQIDEAPSFTGAKTNVVLDGSALRLSDYSVPGSGTYDFGTSVDLGAVYTSRVTASVNVTRVDDGAGLFDDAPGLFDARGGLFDGSSDRSDISVSIEASTSADMTTWSDWVPITVGDLTCRGLKFRAQLTTETAQVTPLVLALSVTVDMPDRVLAGADVVSGAGASAISFDPAFKVLGGVGIAAQDLASGDYYELTSKSASGFTITFKDSGGTAVSRTFDWVARGYGRQT